MELQRFAVLCFPVGLKDYIFVCASDTGLLTGNKRRFEQRKPHEHARLRLRVRGMARWHGWAALGPHRIVCVKKPMFARER